MTEFLVNAVPVIITAILASYFTAMWSLRKFYSERWWERKERAYEQIIEALYDIVQYCEIQKENYGAGTAYLGEKMKELEERYSQAYWKIKKSTVIGAFIVSPEADGILKELRDRPRLKWEENAPWDIYEQDYGYYRKALDKVVDVARRDLKAK